MVGAGAELTLPWGLVLLPRRPSGEVARGQAAAGREELPRLLPAALRRLRGAPG